MIFRRSFLQIKAAKYMTSQDEQEVHRPDLAESEEEKTM